MLTIITNYGHGYLYGYGDGRGYGLVNGNGTGLGIGNGLVNGYGRSNEDTSPLISLDPFEFLALC